MTTALLRAACLFLALAAVAAAQGKAPGPLYLVHFKVAHAMGRAQALAARGEFAAAREAAIAGLRRSASLRGFCFVRFTVGGAETVLRACRRSSGAAMEEKLLARLRANPNVDYADINKTADVNTKAD